MKIISAKIILLCVIILGLHSPKAFSGGIMDKTTDTATLASGCFWCTEAIFEDLKGVQKVTSGYTGGFVKNPTYKDVCDEITGHAEAVQIIFDPSIIQYTKLLEVFFMTHDPTTLNRQGADVGTQYRSAIFYHNDQQKDEAEKVVSKLEQSGIWEDPIVTEITKASDFYVAEDYHQNYFNNNRTAAYCNFVIVPKIEKFQKAFGDLLKENR